MTSERQIEANRRNARKSTGPKSQAGKARAARNAFKYGLASDITNDGRYADEIARLSLKIAGPAHDFKVVECARIIATAALELDRVRRVRHSLIEEAGALGLMVEQSAERSRREDTSISMRDSLSTLRKLLRYEQRAAARRDKAIRRLVCLKVK